VATVTSQTGYITYHATGTALVNIKLKEREWEWLGPAGCHLFIGEVLKSILCDVFDMTVSFSPEHIWPTGTGEAGAPVTSTVTVTTNPPQVGKTIKFSIQLVSKQDHIGHGGTPPLGSFSPAQAVTNDQGICQTTYTSPTFSLAYRVKAKLGTAEQVSSSTLYVWVQPLEPLLENPNYRRDVDSVHPSSYYGTSTAVAGIINIAYDYNAQYYPSGNIPEGEKIKYNDMSLTLGGKFDLDDNFSDGGSHHEHRSGRNVDVTNQNIPGSRWEFMRQAFVNAGSPNFLTEVNPPHWHLRFE
jgi:hypothetical protein